MERSNENFHIDEVKEDFGMAVASGIVMIGTIFFAIILLMRAFENICEWLAPIF